MIENDLKRQRRLRRIANDSTHLPDYKKHKLNDFIISEPMIRFIKSQKPSLWKKLKNLLSKLKASLLGMN